MAKSGCATLRKFCLFILAFTIFILFNGFGAYIIYKNPNIPGILIGVFCIIIGFFPLCIYFILYAFTDLYDWCYVSYKLRHSWEKQPDPYTVI